MSMIAKRLREKKNNVWKKAEVFFFGPLELTQNFINTKKDNDIRWKPFEPQCSLTAWNATPARRLSLSSEEHFSYKERKIAFWF